MVGQETRKEIYRKEVAGMLATQKERKSFDISSHSPHPSYKDAKGTITIDYTNESLKQGYKGTRIIKGHLEIRNGQREDYDFFIKFAEGKLKVQPKDPANLFGADHMRRCVAYVVEEIEPYALDDPECGITPLTTYGALDSYIVTESAGNSLEDALKNKSVDDPNLISTVANNLFAVSQETLEKKFKDNKDFDPKKIHFIGKEYLIYKENTADLFYKGILRLFNQAIGKYEVAVKRLDDLCKEVEKKKADPAYSTNAETLKELGTLIAKLEEEGKRGISGVECIEHLKESQDYRKELFKDLPIIFLPTDFCEHSFDHLRIKEYNETENKTKVRAYIIDNAVYEGESSAGTPREAYEKLKNATEKLKIMPRDMANVAHFLENIITLIDEEFLRPDSPNKSWQDYDIKLQKLMSEWKSSVKYKNTIEESCAELRHKLDTCTARPLSNQSAENPEKKEEALK